MTARALALVQVLVLVSLCSSQICENGICDDHDSCTGTNLVPDQCKNGICSPGELVCPLYSKPTKNMNDLTGKLDVTNDEKWEYLVWSSESSFLVSKIFLYVGVDPLKSDDPKTFPFQFTVEESEFVQMRVSLESLQNPTEMDPIYIALRIENEEGLGSWMSGYFTPEHHHYGGSFSYTSVCHCYGYSHVDSLIDWNKEIKSLSLGDDISLPENDIQCATNNILRGFP